MCQSARGHAPPSGQNVPGTAWHACVLGVWLCHPTTCILKLRRNVHGKGTSPRPPPPEVSPHAQRESVPIQWSNSQTRAMRLRTLLVQTWASTLLPIPPTFLQHTSTSQVIMDSRVHSGTPTYPHPPSRPHPPDRPSTVPPLTWLLTPQCWRRPQMERGPGC